MESSSKISNASVIANIEYWQMIRVKKAQEAIEALREEQKWDAVFRERFDPKIGLDNLATITIK